MVARAPELAALPAELRRGQRLAQEHAYSATAGGDRHVIIEVDGRAVGRMWSAMGEDALVLMDIVLLPEHRGRGTGTAVLGRLATEAEASGVPVRLQVARNNAAAQRLYARLGFRPDGGDHLHLAMERPT